MSDFDPIHIVGLDKDLTSRRGREEELYDVYFTLSRYPSDEWTRVFEECWRSSMSSTFKRARIEQRYLLIKECPLDWVEKFENKMAACIEAANNHCETMAERTGDGSEEQEDEEERKLDELARRFDQRRQEED